MAVAAVRKIVVGLDGSAAASAALAWAIAMARGMQAEVIAVHVLEFPAYWYAAAPGYAEVPAPAQFAPEYRAEIEQSFEQDWCRPLKEAGVRYRTVFREGQAAPVIAQVAETEDADVIVIGRRGRGGFAELLLGSVSHALVLHTKRPVLVISPPPSAAAT